MTFKSNLKYSFIIHILVLLSFVHAGMIKHFAGLKDKIRTCLKHAKIVKITNYYQQFGKS